MSFTYIRRAVSAHSPSYGAHDTTSDVGLLQREENKIIFKVNNFFLIK